MLMAMSLLGAWRLLSVEQRRNTPLNFSNISVESVIAGPNRRMSSTMCLNIWHFDFCSIFAGSTIASASKKLSIEILRLFYQALIVRRTINVWWAVRLTKYPLRSWISGTHNRAVILPAADQNCLISVDVMSWIQNTIIWTSALNWRPISAPLYCSIYGARIGSILSPSTFMDARRLWKSDVFPPSLTALHVIVQPYFTTPNSTVWSGSTGPSKWGSNPMNSWQSLGHTSSAEIIEATCTW